MARSPKTAPPVGVTRSIQLDLNGMRGPVWDQPLDVPYGLSGPWPAVKPFVIDRVIKQLHKVNGEYPDFFFWHNVARPEAASPEESRFWFRVVAYMPRSTQSERTTFINGLRQVDLTETIPLEEMIQGLRSYEEQVPLDQALFLQASWLTPEDMLRLTHAHCFVSGDWYHLLHIYRWLRNRYLPNLSPEDRERACAWVRENLPRAPWPAAQLMAYCALTLGLTDPLADFVAALPDGFFEDRGRALGAHPLLFSLRTPEEVEREGRRLRLPLLCPEHGLAWLAWTEYRGLDLIRDAVLREGKGYYAGEFVNQLASVRAPEVTPLLLDVKLNAKTQAISRKAQAALDAQPGNAIVGLLPLVTQKGKLGEAALQFLLAARQRGLGDFLDEQLRTASPEVVARLAAGAGGVETASAGEERPESELPEWLRQALKKAAGRKQIPDWVLPATLPPVVVDGATLSAADGETVVRALMASTLETPADLVRVLAQKGDRARLAAFGWALFQRWLGATAPSKDRWALLALGHLGDDTTVSQLTALIRVWPGESQHQRAVQGLEVLSTIGTDAALQALNSLALRLKFKALQARAVEKMNAIAKARGLTREQLEDRIVPDLGLSPTGDGRVLDYGPRRFTVVVSDSLVASVRGEDGRLLKDLPKATDQDDAAKATAAQAEWKLFKKQLREVAAIQGERLEQAMVVGRRWPLADFDAFLVRHPLMSRLARNLLWACHDSAGKRVHLFRLDGEAGPVDAGGRPCPLEGNSQVGLTHPLSLSDEERQTWTAVFADNHLEPVFPQLARSTHTLTPEQRQGNGFVPATGRVPGMKLRNRFEQGNWRRVQHDQGGIVGFNKPFVAANVTAVVLIDPCLLLGHPSDDAVEIKRVLFVPGTDEPYNSASEDRYAPTYVRKGGQVVQVEPGLPLSEIDPVVISEVLRDLESLR